MIPSNLKIVCFGVRAGKFLVVPEMIKTNRERELLDKTYISTLHMIQCACAVLPSAEKDTNVRRGCGVSYGTSV